MKKRKQRRAERTRRKRARREEKRQAKGTMTMAEKKIMTAAEIHALVEKGAYAEAINAFADTLAQGDPPQACYADIARAYFELGDYARAASLVTNTLALDAENAAVRILLARICQREHRADDALKVYENLLAVHGAALSYAQRAEIGRYAGLDARRYPDKTRTEYPQLAVLLGLAAPTETSAPQTAASAAAPSAPAAPAPAEAAAFDAAATAAEILAKNIRPLEKCRALNAFAGVAYMDGDYAGAKLLLMETIRLDPGNIDAVRNMALLLHEMGDHEKAIALAAKMRKTDFLLLRALKS